MSSRAKSRGEGSVFYRWSGKGRARRDQCPLPVWQSIQQYLSRSGKLESIQPEDYIFTPLTDRAARLPNVDQSSWTRNQPLSSREVGRLLKKYAKRAGLDPAKIRVHTLRHTAAMLRKQAGDDLDQSRLAGIRRPDDGDETAACSLPLGCSGCVRAR